jgi:hypothetical protein
MPSTFDVYSVGNGRNAVTSCVSSDIPSTTQRGSAQDMPDKVTPTPGSKNGDDYVRRLSKLAARRQLERSAERAAKRRSSKGDETSKAGRTPPQKPTPR